MALIKCSECGKEISDKAACCPNCGCPVSVTIENASSPAQPEQKEEKKSKSLISTKGNKWKMFALVAGILAVIVITLIFAIGGNSGDADNDSNNDVNNGSSQAAQTEQESVTSFSMDAKPVDGKTYQHDDFAYILYDDNSIEIIKYLGNDDDVTISEEINGYAVSRIGESAFKDCTFIEDIYLYADIISIGDYAFENCTSLEDFTLPDVLISVGVSAFEGCTSMTDVYVYGCQTIGDYAFKNCTSLEDFTLPDELVSVGVSAFEGCTSMTDVYVYGCQTIGDCAFKNCTSLEDFTLPDELISVGVSAFEGCTSMTDVYVYGCQTIGDYAFKNCTNLEDFTLPDELVSVGISAFEGCTSLEDVYVYSDDVTFGVNAFANCPKLEEMPEGAYNDYSQLESAEGKSENATSSNGNTETFTSSGCFIYTPRSFMERLDAADKELDGYNYTYMRANGEKNLYYELANIEGGYEHVKGVGMVAFDDSTGSSLSIDDDFTENIIGSITILVEDIDDVPALLVCSMCAADPSLDFMTAYNIGENVISSAETANGYTYNAVNYVITESDEYYFIIISADTTGNSSNGDGITFSETTEYELNFAEFCVPDVFEHTETDGNVMWFQNGENNRMMVKVEKIPSYMKIDTGNGNAITSAKDVVDYYTYSYEDDTISEGWVRIGKLDCYEKVFSVDTDTGVRKGRSIVVPINENEAAIVVLALCEDDELLSAVDTVLKSISY